LIALSHLALKCHITTLMRLACFDSIQQSEALGIEQRRVRAITKYEILQNTEMSKLRSTVFGDDPECLKLMKTPKLGKSVS
jgi:hypothetical protein